MPIPQNLSKFVPDIPVEPVAPSQAPKTAPGQGGFGGAVQRVISGAEDVIGEIFGHKPKVPTAPIHPSIPANLRGFVGGTRPAPSKGTPGSIPENLQQFMKADAPKQEATRADLSKLGKLMVPKLEMGVADSTPTTVTPEESPSIKKFGEAAVIGAKQYGKMFAKNIEETYRPAHFDEDASGKLSLSLEEKMRAQEIAASFAPVGMAEVTGPLTELAQSVAKSSAAEEIATLIKKGIKNIPDDVAQVTSEIFQHMRSPEDVEVALNKLNFKYNEPGYVDITKPQIETPKAPAKKGFGATLSAKLDPALELKKAEELQQKIEKARTFGRTLKEDTTLEKQAKLRSELKKEDTKVISEGETPTPEKPPEVSTETALIEEAKKYPTADEFVTMQPAIYHGTPAKFEKFDTSISEGGASWFTDDPTEITSGKAGAVQGAGQDLTIMERYVAPNIKLATPAQADSLYTDQLIAEGYRGVQYPGDGETSTWTKLFYPNEDTVTKSQIADIWNKAQEAKGIPNIQSAAIQVDGKTYEGADHGEAIQNAKEEGADVSNIDRQRDGLFKMKDGSLKPRAELGGIHSSEVPQLAAKQTPPDPPSALVPIKDIIDGKIGSLDAMRERVEAGQKEIAAEKASNTPPEVKAEEGDQLSTILNYEDGGIESGPFNGWTPDNVKKFQNFVNRRRMDTLEAVGALVKRRYEPLRAAKVDGILRFEGFERDPATGEIVAIKDGPARDGLYGDIQKTNDEFYTAEKISGVPLGYRPNYLRLYLEDPTTGEKFFNGVPLGGKQVGTKPGFALPRQFDTYAEAMKAGYKPVYDNIPDIMAQRAMESERAIANKEFFAHLISTGGAIPKIAIAPGARGSYISLDPDRFPSHSVSYKDKIYNGTFMAPKPLAEKINNYLAEPNKFLKSTAHGFGAIKSFALSVGIPKTGFSVHYWNLLPREVLADMSISMGSAPKDVGTYLYYGFNSSAAGKYVQDNLEKALPLMRAGMTMSSEEHDLKPLELAGKTSMEKVGSVGQYIANFMHDIFAKNVFSRIIPARKLYQGQRMTEFFMKKGMPEEEALRAAAVHVNNLYGGVNWEQLGRSKDWQNFMRTVLIAPDYAETNVNIAKGMFKGMGRLMGPSVEEKVLGEGAMKAGSAQSKIYRNMAYALTGLYITANLINYEESGQWLYQNDPLHQLSIASGKDAQGRTRYINAFGTGTDFFRIPLQLAASIKTGNVNDIIAILRNRLSIPAASTVGLISNVNWAGQRIYGPDNFGNPQSTKTQMMNILNATVLAPLPGSFQGVTGMMGGRTSPEQALLQGLALPIGYVQERPNMQTIKALEAKAKEEIVNGDYTTFNQLVKAKVISSRSRSSFIRSALTGGAKTPRQQRTSAKAKAKTLAEEKALEAIGVKRQK